LAFRDCGGIHRARSFGGSKGTVSTLRLARPVCRLRTEARASKGRRLSSRRFITNTEAITAMARTAVTDGSGRDAEVRAIAQKAIVQSDIARP
jgi:hypothetical protein